MNRVFAGILCLLLASLGYAQTPQTIFEFISAPGDYIGGGQTVVLTPASVDFNPSISTYDNAVHFYLNNFNRPNGGNYIFWSLDLSAPNGAPLQIGSYPNAQRYPFQPPGTPGLALYGDGRGCNQDFGSFQVLDIAIDPVSGNLLRFAANFVQYCESPNAPPLTGAIRFNSSIPPPELIEPAISVAQPLNSHGCYEATSPAGVTVNATASAIGGSNLSFTWSTSTGLKGAGTGFSVPIALNQSLTLSLTATDAATGNSSTVSQQLCSSDTTPPTVTILSPAAGASYRTLPTLAVQVSDAVDKKIKTVGVAIGETANYALDGKEHLSTTLTPRRTVGDMVATQITVTATDASGNVGQSSVNIMLQKDLH